MNEAKGDLGNAKGGEVASQKEDGQAPAPPPAQSAHPHARASLDEKTDDDEALLPLAGFWRRVAALLFDGILLGLFGQLLAWMNAPLRDSTLASLG